MRIHRVDVSLIKALRGRRDGDSKICDTFRRLHAINPLLRLNSIPCGAKHRLVDSNHSGEVSICERLGEVRDAELACCHEGFVVEVHSFEVLGADCAKRAGLRSHVTGLVGVLGQLAVTVVAEGRHRALHGVGAVRSDQGGVRLADSLVTKGILSIALKGIVTNISCCQSPICLWDSRSGTVVGKVVDEAEISWGSFRRALVSRRYF
jgi:hypothetical protein